MTNPITSRRAVLAAPAVLAARPARAQPWPARPIRLIVPFPAGGTTDLLARLLSDGLGARLGQPVVAENRGGAAGVIAAEMAARAEPDGHTLLFCSIGTVAILPHLHSRIGWRPEDLVPIAYFADVPNVIVVRADGPYRSLSDLLDAARARPGELSYASSGNGSSLHLSGEMLKAAAHVDILHIPFRGGADSVNQLLGGRIDLAVNNLPSAIAMIRDGKLRALAVTTAERTPALPEVPTVAESGLPDYEATAWFGLQAPRGTPQPILERLNADTRAIGTDPTVRARAEMVGARVRPGSIADFAAFCAAENAKWAEVIRRAGAKVD
ncbi:tripartite tricarboxylate transporter substrate binding protein [Siccirubricoccus sp. KC 17139]|uniref:Tripartite tricarboxylate transporter substrate binding protein n=1 Tax=Siccirubricoccus soli TaxID=2899147 RepID=A0ABT1CZU0_9PROT|nr:tripartite tricarboxylate transporter substrate binding protein [Siccirubricoccus soli]MCO6414932.1 tripartite tricarboxylate transporter substrate binding protein [Siccirubricoccus soli]MCP2681062.1 tripartite tricarboxylate transporter substrate binding protein [Siccirubricoccus soli]